ncbi:DUF2382 domain-containing protein [Lentzea jiangxiensis]|uniref:Conserved domain-containing protein n=1 Tax=Lentzea jiangxiensis TaxID=641025 RepID=A0A1H0VRL9_9PSEU|nr:PRC and DUF2382 domain-containing protein [Lentzea jiangxiensis]SDP81004.1 conserved domain-containing protein [Lentzea jiangxiensis]
MTNTIRERMTHWTGREVHDPAGDKIGTVAQLWFDDDSGQPTWLSVSTGLFGLRESFLPVQGITEDTNGDLRTPYTKDQVKDAPNIDADGAHLDTDEEERLYNHYGVSTARNADAGYVGGGRDITDRDTTGRDTTGRGADEAMTRSEERLKVGTEQREAGRARLRKYVVTETEQVEVPVTREKVRLEREPITEANRGEALSGPAISEAEHEVTLHEERPVVDTEAVPVERVRLSKEQVTDTETVSGEVRKERIDTDAEGDVDQGRHGRR